MQNAVTKKELASSHKVEDDEVRDEKFNKLTRIWRITEAMSEGCHWQYSIELESSNLKKKQRW